jgi:hypothetical protein
LNQFLGNKKNPLGKANLPAISENELNKVLKGVQSSKENHSKSFFQIDPKFLKPLSEDIWPKKKPIIAKKGISKLKQ